MGALQPRPHGDITTPASTRCNVRMRRNTGILILMYKNAFSNVTYRGILIPSSLDCFLLHPGDKGAGVGITPWGRNFPILSYLVLLTRMALSHWQDTGADRQRMPADWEERESACAADLEISARMGKKWKHPYNISEQLNEAINPIWDRSFACTMKLYNL